MDFQTLLSYSATISTIGLFLSGIQICVKIRTQGNTQNISIFPFVAGVINTVLWTKYGVLVGDSTVIFTNGIGIILQISYVLVYYLNTNDRKDVHSKILYMCLIIYPALAAVKFINMSTATAIHYIGLLSSCATVLMVGAPLTVVAQVIKTKSTESLPFPLSFAGFVVAAQWCLYGRLVHDSFIQIPNFLGMLLGAIQMVLFIKYPSNSRKFDLGAPTNII